MKTEIVITPIDIYRFFKRNFRFVMVWSFTCACVGMIIALTLPLKYKQHLDCRVLTFQFRQTGNAVEILKSTLLKQQMIEKLGMQVKISDRSLPDIIMQRVKENWLFGCTSTNPSEKEYFQFNNVLCNNETPLSLYLLCKENDYELLSSDGKSFGTALLGEPIYTSFGQMTLSSVPSHIKKNRPYSLVIYPMMDVLKQEHIKVFQDKGSNHIISLQFQGDNRFLGSQLINALITTYQTTNSYPTIQLLDSILPPNRPITSPFWKQGMTFYIAMTFLLYGFLFCKECWQEFPVSESMLVALSFPYLGSWKKTTEEQILYRLLDAACGQITLFIEGDRINAASAYANLLSYQKGPTLLIPFEKEALHALETDLAHWKERYKHIVISTNYLPTNMKAHLIAKLADVIVVAVRDEKPSSLQSYLEMPGKHIQFIYAGAL